MPIEIFTLPEPVAPTVPVAAQTSAPAESTEGNRQPPVDPGDLVFQLSLGSSEPRQKLQVSTTEESGTGTFLSAEEIPFGRQTQAGASGPDTKSQNQGEQFQDDNLPLLPQLPAPGADGNIASQFGFQTPLSFVAQDAAPKTENVPAAAFPRSPESAPSPDAPMAPSVERVGLTIRGADDQVVRVEINQSGELVQVGVHTGNRDLANELRASVPELMRHLDQQGYESKVNLPGSSYASLAPAVVGSAHSEFRSGTDTGGNAKSGGHAAPQEEMSQQRQRNPQRAWRELASRLPRD